MIHLITQALLLLAYCFVPIMTFAGSGSDGTVLPDDELNTFIEKNLLALPDDQPFFTAQRANRATKMTSSGNLGAKEINHIEDLTKDDRMGRAVYMAKVPGGYVPPHDTREFRLVTLQPNSGTLYLDMHGTGISEGQISAYFETGPGKQRIAGKGVIIQYEDGWYAAKGIPADSIKTKMFDGKDFNGQWLPPKVLDRANIRTDHLFPENKTFRTILRDQILQGNKGMSQTDVDARLAEATRDALKPEKLCHP